MAKTLLQIVVNLSGKLIVAQSWLITVFIANLMIFFLNTDIFWQVNLFILGYFASFWLHEMAHILGILYYKKVIPTLSVDEFAVMVEYETVFDVNDKIISILGVYTNFILAIILGILFYFLPNYQTLLGVLILTNLGLLINILPNFPDGKVFWR